MGKGGKPPPRKKVKHDEPGSPDSMKGEDASTSQLANGEPAVEPAAAARKPPRARSGQDQAADDQGQSHRRSGRRQGNTGTTSACADALQPPPAPTPVTKPAAAAAATAGGPAQRCMADSDSIMEAVVKVFCVHTEPNFSLPWQRKRQYSSSSSGFIIDGRRILTNAHCVDHHTQVKVKRRGSDKKFVANVLAVGTECDIAMLSVEDDDFWTDVEPVAFGALPQLQESVTVVGYPIGGDTMSVTSGVVSRIEVTSYVHGAAELLGIQIDAAINSGNSGGPAFNSSGLCVGIAFQSLKHEDAENIGYIIPTPVIQHFITDYERNGAYTGFPCLGVEWQKMENPDMRRALNMKPEQKGVLIRRIEPTAPVSKVLSQYDILQAFDGTEIANDGTVPFRSGERISFSYLVSQKYTNEKAELKVLHKGVARTVSVALQAPVRLIPFHIKGAPPSYFIVAGLVFTPATVPYLRSEYGKEYDFDAPVKLLDKMMHAQAEVAEQQVVVLSQVLANEVNIGYEEILNTQVLQLNGKRILNMRDLVAAVDSCGQDYLHFDLDYNQKVVLGTKRAREVTQEILETHCIASDRSPDLQQANGKAPAAGANGNAKAGPSGVTAKQQQQQDDMDEEPAEEAAGKGAAAAAAAGSKRAGGRRGN